MTNERKLSDANLEIMKLVWQKGREVTINDIFEAVNAGRRKKVKRATVQVQMRRLEAYGWLKHRVEEREFVYSTLRGEDDAKRSILDGIRDRVFGGSTAELVKCLFKNGSLSDEELLRIREILNKGKRD
ncbi:MAG: BlaI/MecI/CopY family transcriptional regulator [Candidatus Aminicenantes bacterium]|nr:BlaI/MecI/CopY family transcriptional regulator [Candidatus Aminicenantes bacterium]